jgi:serine/threonine protein kinase
VPVAICRSSFSITYDSLSLLRASSCDNWVSLSRRCCHLTCSWCTCSSAEGLRFLSSRNLIHRDIKPQNLLLTKFATDAGIKIADFGFARHLAQADLAQTLCGTPLYMAPEIMQFRQYDAKADLWSVGAVLYEMVCC